MGEDQNSTGDDGGLKGYITKHMLIGVVLAVAIIIALKIVLGLFETSDQALTDLSGNEGHDPAGLEAVLPQTSPTLPGDGAIQPGKGTHVPESSPILPPRKATPEGQATAVAGKDTGQAHGITEKKKTHPAPANAQASGSAAGHAPETHAAETPSFPVVGMAFVDAVIRPLDYELNRRFYGWRPNDIVNFTDNINNFQLGVLEVTRRTTVILTERISRTGSTAAFEGNLENAMNWFMIKAERYWFPSAESKYKAGLNEIRTYFHKLERGESQFYTRTDNLIPLLMAYQDLLGSCDEHLVKSREDDGSTVSYFKSDDYFFYAKGVATTMAVILEAVAKDFNIMMSREGGLEVLHHAIESCHHAMEIDPWIILNSNLSSVLANHRLNMAAPISHARFYLGVLIKALST